MATDLSSIGYSQPLSYYQLTPGGQSITPAQNMASVQSMATAAGFSDPYAQNFSWIGSGQYTPEQQDWLAGQTAASPFNVNDPLNKGASWTPQGRVYGPLVGTAGGGVVSQYSPELTDLLYAPGGAFTANPSPEKGAAWNAMLPDEFKPGAGKDDPGFQSFLTDRQSTAQAQIDQYVQQPDGTWKNPVTGAFSVTKPVYNENPSYFGYLKGYNPT